MGNSLDALLLKDKSTLISSNVSWKIFRINSSGEKETYLEDPELVGIRDMMLSKDNKIYFVQDALYERINDSTIITTRPKRAMSIDSLKNINFEFELPDKKSSYSLLSVRAENPLYAGNRSQLGGQLKIVENSQKGKKQTGIDFFVSDFLENRIYDVRKDSSMYSVDIFKENLVAPPVAIKTDNQGNLYVLTSPLLNPDTTIVSQEPMILSIDSTRVATPIYSFSSENFDFSGPEYFEEGLSGRFSRLFSCSMNLFETDIDVAFFITLSHNGKLLKLEATKP